MEDDHTGLKPLPDRNRPVYLGGGHKFASEPVHLRYDEAFVRYLHPNQVVTLQCQGLGTRKVFWEGL